MSYEFRERGPNGPRNTADNDKGFPTALGLVEGCSHCTHVVCHLVYLLRHMQVVRLKRGKTLQIFVRHRYAPKLLHNTLGLTTSPIGTVSKPIKLIAAGMAETMPTTRPRESNTGPPELPM